MRVLDLGCGSGQDLGAWGVTDADRVTGLDIDFDRLAVARTRFSRRTFVHSIGECLPFQSASLDRVISAVALPYMNVPQALAEMHRVLVPGGAVALSLHLPEFTMAELHKALPKPVPTIFRLYVMANGLLFHFSGKTGRFVNGRTESFQTERGMTIALARAGFINPAFDRGKGNAGPTFRVKAEKPREVPVARTA